MFKLDQNQKKYGSVYWQVQIEFGGCLTVLQLLSKRLKSSLKLHPQTGRTSINRKFRSGLSWSSPILQRNLFKTNVQKKCREHLQHCTNRVCVSVCLLEWVQDRVQEARKGCANVASLNLWVCFCSILGWKLVRDILADMKSKKEAEDGGKKQKKGKSTDSDSGLRSILHDSGLNGPGRSSHWYLKCFRRDISC